MDKLNQFHKSQLGLLIFCVAELAASYGFASLAIDRGNLVWYFLALVFLIGALQNFVKFIGSFFHGKHPRS